LQATGLTITGDITATGNVNGVDGVFSGNVSAVDVTATGNVSGLLGTFTSGVSGGTF